jgi:hypothetical protein
VLWRQRKWRLLLNLIDHLPADSHMNAVLLNDLEYARMVKAEQKKRERSGEESLGPSIATWSPQVNLLAVIADRLAALIQSNSANPRTVVPYARPKTAFDRLDREEMDAVHKRLTAALIPQG